MHHPDQPERKSKPLDRSFRRNRFESGCGTGAKTMAHSPSKQSTSMQETNSLLRQNQELRERLDTYKQAQQNQAALVARLQSKVLQYKRKCNELEDRMCDDTVGPPSPKPTKVLHSITQINHQI